MADAGSFATQLGVGPEWARAFVEVERLVGGRIVSAEKQPRWRPAFFLDVDCARELRRIYLRGDRGEMQHGVYGLDHEYRVLCALEAEGVPVPHIYGFLSDPLAIVMARAPGRVNLATAKDDAERGAVLDHWIDILAAMHRLPLARFEALGIERPLRPEQLGLGDFPRWEKSWRDRKNRPDPRIEWVIRWLHRNVPKHRSKPAMLQGDAGQFLFENGRVTAMIDLELAYIGDPLADLAGMLNRDLSEPMGDLNRAFHRYADLMGEPLDVKTVWYHTARFGICTPIACAPLLAAPPAQFNHPVYLGWDIVYGRICLEAIARFSGIGLREPELPEPEPSRHAPGFAQLLATLASAPRGYEVDTATRIAQWVREIDARGARLEAQDAGEVARLTGKRTKTWLEADQALEEFVIAAGPERDEHILHLLYRRTKRQQALMQPALRELEHARLSEIRAGAAWGSARSAAAGGFRSPAFGLAAVPGLELDPPREEHPDWSQAGRFTAEANAETAAQLLNALGESLELGFYDDAHPTISDPGAYASARRDGGRWLLSFGNHGWSSGWFAVSESDLIHYLALCIPWNRGAVRDRAGKSTDNDVSIASRPLNGRFADQDSPSRKYFDRRLASDANT